MQLNFAYPDISVARRIVGMCESLIYMYLRIRETQ